MSSDTLTGYELSRQWWDWCFENPERVSPNHSALYFFIIELCNRLGWKEKFGLPMEAAKDATGIKNYKTYTNTFKDLLEWGFIMVIQKSKNQYTATIIALVKNTKAHSNALDKAFQKHSQNQHQGIVGIDKQETIEQETFEPLYNKKKDELFSVLKKIYIEIYPDYYFTAKDVAAIKAILKKIQFNFNAKNMEAQGNHEEIVDSFRLIIQNPTDWMIKTSGTSPQMFNHQFENIKSKLNGKFKQKANKASDIASAVELAFGIQKS